MKVLTCSRRFPKGHPKAGKPTHFVEKIWNGFRQDDFSLPDHFIPWADNYSLLLSSENYLEAMAVREIKHHTIRAGNRWKVGDKASLRVWSDKPYRSKQIEFAQVEVKKVWEFVLRPIKENGEVNIYGFINDDLVTDRMAKEIANNDGLSPADFDSWFCPEGTKYILSLPIFTGQIICWSDQINYLSKTTSKPDLQTT